MILGVPILKHFRINENFKVTSYPRDGEEMANSEEDA